MPIECTTVGMKFAYCVEATAGTRPTSGYTVLDGIVSVGAITITQNPLQVVLPAEKKYRYLKGKDDISGEVDVVMYKIHTLLAGKPCAPPLKPQEQAEKAHGLCSCLTAITKRLRLPLRPAFSARAVCPTT